MGKEILRNRILNIILTAVVTVVGIIGAFILGFFALPHAVQAMQEQFSQLETRFDKFLITQEELNKSQAELNVLITEKLNQYEKNNEEIKSELKDLNRFLRENK